MKKLFPLICFILFFQIAKAQTEFITIWQPGIVSTPVVTVDAPSQATSNQIWFPGTGTNYTIQWEEIGFPQHHGIMENVTSTGQILIDFGIPSKEDGANTTYRVKVSNGNGVFQQIRFATHQPLSSSADVLLPQLQMKGSADKLLTIEQWGNIQWTSMNAAFANCQRVDITATDSPNLSQVNDASLMFYRANSFSGGNAMQNWGTSTIQNFSFMFALQHVGQIYSPTLNNFNPPNLNNWDVSAATNISYMFAGRALFNQNISSWDVSNVTTAAWMFTACNTYNQPLNSWNTSNFRYINNMFSSTGAFNQPLDNWDTSEIINMNGAFSVAQVFNQPLEMWDVGKVKKMGSMFDQAQNFNQPLGNWNLLALENALGIFGGSGMNCENYSKTLLGWADNSNTADNVLFSNLQPMQYAANITAKRDILIGKGWTFSGDVLGSCLLGTNEAVFSNNISIYPNPVTDFIYIKNLKSKNVSYKIIDASGRILDQNILNGKNININSLVPGNYILQIITQDKTQPFKFIKK